MSDHAALLAELQCCVCTNIPAPPWRGCCAGHVICDACKTGVSPAPVYPCPACRHEGTLVPCRHLEQLVRHIDLHAPCAYDTCPESVPCVTWHAHVQTCTHAPFACPMACGWRGPRSAVLVHVRSLHPCPLITADAPLELRDMYVQRDAYWCGFVSPPPTSTSAYQLVVLHLVRDIADKAGACFVRLGVLGFDNAGDMLTSKQGVVMVLEQCDNDIPSTRDRFYCANLAPAGEIDTFHARPGDKMPNVYIGLDPLFSHWLCLGDEREWAKRPRPAADEPAAKRQKQETDVPVTQQ